MTMLWLYLILINAAAWLLMRKDKKNARQHRFRVPETVLLGIGLLGGSLGGVCGMVMFHHKTRKPVFSIGLPVMLFIHLGILLWFT